MTGARPRVNLPRIFIRVFNLPVFFAIAGFFAAYLMETRGTRGFLRHRWSRLGVPLLVAWPVLAATMFLTAPFAARFSAVPPSSPAFRCRRWSSSCSSRRWPPA